MKRLAVLLGAFAVVASLLVLMVGVVGADDGDRNFKAKLGGYNEVPAVSTTGSGEFRARLSKDGTSLDYTL